MQPEQQLKIRLPADIKTYLSAEAHKNGSSQNSEVIRSVRERMERAKPTTGESLQATAPAAGHHDTALAGGPEIQALEMPR